VKRGFFIAQLVLGFVAAGACSAVAVAGQVVGPPKAVKATKPAPYIAARVKIAGVSVGGLDRGKAIRAVESRFERPVTVVVDGAIVHLHPIKLAVPYVETAVSRAHVAATGANVDMVVSVRGADVRAVVAKLARRFDHKGVPASLEMRAGQPVVTPDRTGHRLDTGTVVAGIVHALAHGERTPLRFKTKTIKPSLTRRDVGPVILINRSLNRLTYYAQGLVRRFPVATGQSIYPTPRGRFHIVVKWVNPWWYPPTYDSWAKGLKPVPPGPGNPLGTRWMGLSAPGVGIHGTNNPSSIGYSISHGCIRMQVPDAEWLFDHVGLGTTVFIV
jgi:lipoprotein-anchoring transpeptidase ErfK/SrfK